jgi:putative CocE/NonD family hydrolase
VQFNSDTAAHYREKIQAPFFAHYLLDKGDPPPEARVFQTGANKWQTHAAWPPKAAAPRKLFFHANGKLAFDPPKEPDGVDEYVSDPANPVPFYPRPIRPVYGVGSIWGTWMLQDQRFTQGRPDVLCYVTDPLTEDVTVAGGMKAKLFASTSGTDCDWVVRLIDVYPEDYAKPADMAGFQLLIAGEPVRARFRKSFEKPEPVKPNTVEEYAVDLVWGHHRFRKGHRIMVQVSSTWFPVIDRNPQTFVPNIYEAEDKDFQKATQRVVRSAKFPSHMVLDVLKE